MILGMDGCPFEPDSKSVKLDEEQLVQTVLSALGSITSAANLLSISLVDDHTEYSVDFIRQKMFETAVSAIAEANQSDFDTVFKQIKSCTGA